MRIRFGIIVCEETTPLLRKLGVGSRARLYEDWLGQVASKANFKTYLAYNDRLPVKADECDAYIISGSRHNISEQLAWMQPLFNFLRITAKAQIPVIGLGFGNQAIAHALGGRAGPASGWSIGRHTWKLVRDEGWLQVGGKTVSLFAFSRNQVVKLPSRSIRIVSGSGCPNAAFRVANHSVGIHGHPEYSARHIELLLAEYADQIPEAAAEAARTSLNDGPIDVTAVANWAAHFAYRG
ncbi:MAG: type 1 glutamine amidotransferase [Betaproteobacteria bacterium]|nr:type 1 glutamine amidotransferase [Betaproteobacteria bacterium]